MSKYESNLPDIGEKSKLVEVNGELKRADTDDSIESGGANI